MTLKTIPYPGAKEWQSIVNEMVDFARKGNQRAQAWFKGSTWAELKLVLFTEARATYIERLVFATNKAEDSEERSREPKVDSQKTRERKAKVGRERWERYWLAHPEKRPKPKVKKVVAKVALVTKVKRERNEYMRRYNKNYKLNDAQRQHRREQQKARYHQLKAERAQQAHLPTGDNHATETVEHHIA